MPDIEHSEVVENTINESLGTFLNRMQEDWDSACAAHTAACEKGIAQANRHRRKAQFAVGDWVLLQIFPKARGSSAGDYHVLSPRFAGPCQVRVIVTHVTYLLCLPPNTAWNTSKGFTASWFRPYHAAPPPATMSPAPTMNSPLRSVPRGQ